MKAQKIIDAGLCLGCGFCQSIGEKEFVQMKLNSEGFNVPQINGAAINEAVVSKVCPGVNIDNDQVFGKSERIWGKILKSYSAHSVDSEIRTKGSSGGIISAIAIHLLESGSVDAVLQVGGDPANYHNNVLKISRTRQDVLSCAASRYAPASVFNNILNILGSTEETYCFIGKPCDVSALKNMLKVYPQYKDRIHVTIAIFCAGMPSFNATRDAVNSFGEVTLPVTNLSYRGMGWPGYFSFRDAIGKLYQMSYNDSWGKILGRQVHFRCKICPDGIGLEADFAVGDAWETKDGYPDFKEKEGESLVLLRSEKAVGIFEGMSAAKKVSHQPLATETIGKMQPFQYYRRQYVGARILAVKMYRFWNVNFQNLNIWGNLAKASPMLALRECLGTMKRLV
jgi:coenzyme F420 hydrogenase subunit beta